MLSNFFYKLLVLPTSNVICQFVRYAFVGGLAFVVDFGLLYVLTEYLSLYYILSASLSFIVGLLINYFISILWVFSDYKSSNRVAEFIYFALIGIVGLLLNVFILWLITEFFDIYYMYSKLIAAVVVYLWNFLARKYFLFSKNRL
ncbi:GtrA family protein [uncultured Bacteroides sp.]|mgnify:CR=1 FL=1|uniref:GtrA family protein n=1 Tax=uncultured Bacteroides sp. TaxID=162156 RepID=UPI0025F2DF54|nr:GtrA family protein [uncultured Bacteroides sp.]